MTLNQNFSLFNSSLHISFSASIPFPPLFHTEVKSSKLEPGEVSPRHSSTSSKREGSLKRGRGGQEFDDSEEDGDLLEDEDEVKSSSSGSFTLFF